MQTVTNWLLEELSHPAPTSLLSIQERHHAKEDTFNLSEVLSFMPERYQGQFLERLFHALSPSINALKQAPPSIHAIDSLPDDQLDEHIAAVRAASELTWLFVQKREKVPEGKIFDIICDLHQVLLALPDGQGRNQVAKICEWFWGTGDERREAIVPQTVLFLLLKSFGAEGEMVLGREVKGRKRGGSARDVARVYAMRKALEYLELSEEHSDSETIRNLLLRCTTSAVYVRVDHGCKFLSYLLTVDDIRDAVFKSLLNQMANLTKTRARYYGGVFLYAWKLEKSDWLFKSLMDLAEKAIYSATEPFGVNLRAVLRSFHNSKRVVGVDQLLNRLYGPILYKNLMVANPLVRRNAVTILAEAFPIHDPNTLVQDIEQTIAFQCGKLLELLNDPSPIVRRETIQGTCGILGYFWELVPLQSAKRMLDIITTKLAFDKSSAQVRMSVFQGLRYVAKNHLAHQVLAIALRRLRPLIHDRAERVRLAFLDLLITVKEKRIPKLRYFDIVPLDDLLARLSIDSPSAASKIMSLVVTAYFPLERKGKTAEKVLASQVRACLSMFRSNKEACEYFYQHVNLFVAPGPLCEFVMSLSAVALESPDVSDNVREVPGRKTNRRAEKTKRRTRTRVNDENEAPTNSENGAMLLSSESDVTQKQPSRNALLRIVADVLAAISPSLDKPSNRGLRRHIDDIYGGEALRSLLIDRGNSQTTRAICWRIASCITPSKMQPLTILWHEQMNTVLGWHRTTDQEIQGFESLLAALVTCGIRWKLLSSLSSTVSKWSHLSSGYLGNRVTKKSRRKTKTNSKSKVANQFIASESNLHSVWSENRLSALFALQALAMVLMREGELQDEFRLALLQGPDAGMGGDGSGGYAMEVVCSIRKGCIGAVDDLLESCGGTSERDEKSPRPEVFLHLLLVLWKLLVGLLSGAHLSEALSHELRELFHWTASGDLLVKARSVNERFALGIARIPFQFSADLAGIGYLKGNDMDILDTIASNLATTLQWSDGNLATGPVAELLRLSFQLRAHYCYVMGDPDRNKESLLPLGKASRSLLSRACDILASCKIQGSGNEETKSKTPLLDGFMRDTLIAFCDREYPSDMCEAIGDKLNSVYLTADSAKSNLLAAVISNAVQDLATRPPKDLAITPLRVYDSLISSLRMEPDEQPSKNASAHLTWAVVNSISKVLEDSDDIPSDEARHFLASLEVAIQHQYGDGCDESGERDELHDCLSEIRMMLGSLQKLCISSRETLSTHSQENAPPRVDEIRISAASPG